MVCISSPPSPRPRVKSFACCCCEGRTGLLPLFSPSVLLPAPLSAGEKEEAGGAAVVAAPEVEGCCPCCVAGGGGGRRRCPLLPLPSWRRGCCPIVVESEDRSWKGLCIAVLLRALEERHLWRWDGLFNPSGYYHHGRHPLEHKCFLCDDKNSRFPIYACFSSMEVAIYDDNGHIWLAAVAALCVQYEADFRPNMTIVVKALQPLLNSRAGGPAAEAP